ncbi:hypothetical protein ABL78_6581 [Leptomonas seymouri]|uniref:Uncharacterized protein n=1 Tax=Leptomonas seymouri TaxID=5684 RepID=A0A0N1HV70_LEPSE|nr:hypothetical protein ABL78_6581 [Leptomonas seymouri]|eukprot:KPI84374.1 hypothetical protein ABL78_6581 [Leptomonas seymouri]
MGWWPSLPLRARVDAADETRLHDAQNVIASIFEPGNRAFTSAPAAGTNTNPRTRQSTGLTSSTSLPTPTLSLHSGTPDAPKHCESTPGGLRESTERMNAWLPLWPSSSSPPASSGNAAEAESAFPLSPTTTTAASASGRASPPPSWDQLPPSPLAGYELTKRGLVDTLHTPPHTLTRAELKDLIGELSAIEQKVTYGLDKQFAGHIGSRSLHGLELLVNPCLLLTGAYLMTWKTMQLYNGALPQNSIVFTKILSLLHRRMPADQREQLAQRYRRLMRATNARVTLSFLTGLGVFSLAWVSRPSKDVMEQAPDMLLAKETSAYQQHAAASLKWCWYVYYHHPTYRSSGDV